MPDDPSARRPSGPAAFWRSLPGVLTGIAAVVAAVGTLATVFEPGGGGGGAASPSSAQRPARAAPAGDTISVASPPPVEVSSTDAAAAAEARRGCFGRVFAGVPVTRLGPVEVGTDQFDVVVPSERQAGPVGLRFTDRGRTVGGARVTWVPTNGIFRVDAVVDDRCRAVGDYAPSVDPSQKDVMKASDGLRMHLAGRFYQLRLDGGSAGVRVGFIAAA